MCCITVPGGHPGELLHYAPVGVPRRSRCLRLVAVRGGATGRVFRVDGLIHPVSGRRGRMLGAGDACAPGRWLPDDPSGRLLALGVRWSYRRRPYGLHDPRARMGVAHGGLGRRRPGEQRVGSGVPVWVVVA